MSIVWTLKKVVDPVRAAQEEIDRKKEQERPKQAVAGDGPGDGDVEANHTFYRCRVCGHEGERGYCPECLADTMEPGGASEEDSNTL